MDIFQVRLLRRLGLIVLSLVGLFVLNQIVLRISRRVHTAPMPPSKARWLDSPMRRRLFGTPEQIMDRAGVTPGMRVLEIGPGAGFFTVPLARCVAAWGMKGSVTCVELQPEMIELLRQRLHAAKVDNVNIIQGDAQHLSLPEKSFDLVFLVTVLGEIVDPSALFSECARVLKPGGVLAVTEQVVDPDFRLPTTALKLATHAGLVESGCVGLPWWSYTARYYKPVG